jgi:virginiamycin B lyase
MTTSAVTSVVREPDGAAGPYGITKGPDDAPWFTLNQANAIGRITLDGDVALHPLPTQAAAPVGIVCGGDGALWFTEIGAGRSVVSARTRPV